MKAIQAENSVGWPILTESNVRKCYPETAETPKGHLNQKHVRSIKPAPFAEGSTKTIRVKKERDLCTKVYDVREIILYDQTGQFPKRSLRGNTYIIVLVEIDSNTIVAEPTKSRKDVEVTRAYRSMMKRLCQSGIVPRKHVLDNKVSENKKAIIQDEFKMQMELVPPGCHR